MAQAAILQGLQVFLPASIRLVTPKRHVHVSSHPAYHRFAAALRGYSSSVWEGWWTGSQFWRREFVIGFCSGITAGGKFVNKVQLVAWRHFLGPGVYPSADGITERYSHVYP